jgi:hypothetical protein
LDLIIVIDVLDPLYFRRKFLYPDLVRNILITMFINTRATGEGTCFGSPRLVQYISDTYNISIVLLLKPRYTSGYQITTPRTIITY